MPQIGPLVTQSTEISDGLEYVELDDGSSEIRTDDVAIILDEDAAYKLMLCLQSRFPNTPIIEHLNV